jgi:hypothetical protein
MVCGGCPKTKICPIPVETGIQNLAQNQSSGLPIESGVGNFKITSPSIWVF